MECGETISESLMVAAIDFGTTFSGYAFAIRNDYKVDPTRVFGSHWHTGSQPGPSLKTPTCILFDQNQVFDSFGGEAEDKYTELAQEEEHMDWFFFKKFKMQLYAKKGISRDFMIEGENGCLMPAMRVFTESIKFLRMHLEEQLRSKTDGIKPQEIYWVLTVPPIWSDPAKQFMREAANNGGIPSSRLTLALEPEAASIYCINLPVDRTISSGCSSTLDVFPAGTKYLILDAGDGTTDITVQEIKPDGYIKQIFIVRGDWGGVKVDQAFDEFMLDIVGMETMDKFRNEKKAEYLSLCRDFEIKRRGIRPDSTAKISFRIPLVLSENFQEVKGVALKDSLKSNKSMSWVGDKLCIDPDIFKDFFSKSCRQITHHLNSIFQEPAVVDTDIILMVGDFSETKMLQGAIKSAYHKKLVIIPEEPGLAVLKGAVHFGFNPKIINPRISRFTYGISTIKRSRPHINPENKKNKLVNDIRYCCERFGKLDERDQPIDVVAVTDQRTYNPLKRDQRRKHPPINASFSVDSEYVVDTENSYLGDLKVDVSDIQGGCEREVVVEMRFGETDFAVEAVVKFTGEKVDARFNFLR